MKKHRNRQVEQISEKEQINKGQVRDRENVSLEKMGWNFKGVELLPLPVASYQDMQTLNDKEFEKLLEESINLFHDGAYKEVVLKSKSILKSSRIIFSKHYPFILEILAVALEKLGEIKEAVKVNHLFSYYAPDEHMAHTNLSRLYMLQGQIETAETEKGKSELKLMRKSLASGEGASHDKNASQLMIKDFEKQLEQKKKRFLDILEIEPNEEIALFQLGKISYDARQYNEAKKYLLQFLKVSPRHSLGHALLTKSFYALNQESHAREWLVKGLEIARANGDIMPLKLLEEVERKIGIKKS